MISFGCWAEALPASDVAPKMKSEEPINIAADSLDIDQEKNIGTFKGNVIAEQENIKIVADKMVVHYTAQDKNKDSSQAQRGFEQKISKIETFGNVKMFAEQKEAYADRGEYDIEKDLLYLFDNVKLIQDQNILYGDKLSHDITSGKTNIVSNKSEETNKRVRVIFTPKKQDKKE